MALRRSLPLLFLISSLLPSCVKTPTILRDGIEMPVEEAARLDYREGESFLARKRYKEATARYRRIAEQMPMSTPADNAMFRLAQIQRNQENVKGAITTLEALLSKYPVGDAATPAKEELGKILHSRKDYRRAAEIFATIPWKEVSPSSRPALEKTVRATFDEARDDRAKLNWLLSVWDATAETPRNEPLAAEIVDLLDRAANEEDLGRIFKSREPRFPAGYAAFKLAKIAYHAGRRDEAKDWAATFLNRFPGHEFAREAVELSESLVRTEETDPLSIGLLLPLTGGNQVYASQVLRGVALAVDLFGTPKPNMPAVTFQIEDTGDDPEQASAAVEKLVRERRVIAAIGPVLSRESQVAAVAALPFSLPVVSLSPAEGLTEIGENVFRNSLTKSEQAEGLAKLAVENLGIKRAAILYPQNNYGTEFMALFWKEFAARGGEIRGAEAYDPEGGDYGGPIKRLVGVSPLELRPGEFCSEKEMNQRLKDIQSGLDRRLCYTPDKLPPIVDFEAVFIPDGFERVTQIVPALAFYDVRGLQVLGSNLLNTPELFRARGGEAMQGTLFLDGFFRNKKEPPVPDFVQRYYATFGSEPGVLEAQAFDTASIVLDIIARKRPSSRSAFAEALRDVRGFPGVSGETSFAGSRDARRKLTPLIVDGEQIVELN